jgi:hypothetical protein
MSIGDEGSDVLIYLVLLIPLELILASPRLSTQKAVVAATALLTLVSGTKLGFELARKEPSYYDLVGVAPGASFAEIKRGYKHASLKVHPDKRATAGNNDDDGDEAFVALKAAYDVLADAETRGWYDRLGPSGVENRGDTTALISRCGFFYVVWLAVAYLLTRRKAVARAQTWSFTGLLALGVFEYQARALSFDFFEELLPHLAMFEKIDLLHRLFPVYLLGARVLASHLHEDVGPAHPRPRALSSRAPPASCPASRASRTAADTYNALLLQSLHAKTDALMLAVRGLQVPLAEAAGGAAVEGTALWNANADALAKSLPLLGGAGAAGSAPAAPVKGRGLSRREPCGRGACDEAG